MQLVRDKRMWGRSALDYYSPDYFAAKRRFVAACERLGIERQSLRLDAPSPTGEPLTIDVAVAGAGRSSRALVVSSGVHGVEGFLGSAVQLAFLEQLSPNWRPRSGSAVILIHAVNPFGFAWQRRFNEDNVDLNRNFLLDDEEYAGAPPLCGAFRQALMRRSNRMKLATVASRLALLAMRHGSRSFWETLPVGQYEYPDWLFFGGSARSQSAAQLDGFFPLLLDTCEEVVHLDFHTGLGRWGDCKLLLPERDSAANASWWGRHFGVSQVVESNAAGDAYQIRGGFGSWLQARFPQARYRFATAEFGTYSPLRVVRALADELHFHAQAGTRFANHPARQRLTDTFVPRSVRWRTRALETGLSLIWQAAAAPESSAAAVGMLSAAS
jgi:predicted deacylase